MLSASYLVRIRLRILEFECVSIYLYFLFAIAWLSHLLEKYDALMGSSISREWEEYIHGLAFLSDYTLQNVSRNIKFAYAETFTKGA